MIWLNYCLSKKNAQAKDYDGNCSSAQRSLVGFVQGLKMRYKMYVRSTLLLSVCHRQASLTERDREGESDQAHERFWAGTDGVA